MQRRQFVSYVLERGFVVAIGGAACSAAGCGALIHPERCGQPHSNQIDWKIAALDGVGLLLFFVPGVIAFVVDFCTGAIYLPIPEAYPCYGAYGPLPPGSVVLPPPPQYSAMPAAPMPAPVPTPAAAASSAPALGQPSGQELGFKRLAIPREQLERERIERVVAQHVGRRVSLDDRQARVSALAQIDHFDEQAGRHRSDSDFGVSVRTFFDRLMGA